MAFIAGFVYLFTIEWYNEITLNIVLSGILGALNKGLIGDYYD